MDYINYDAEIIEGDEIVTSNLSSIFPPGLKIGYVKEIHTDTNGLTKYATISPVVDFQHLENVLVITDSFVHSDYEQDIASAAEE
jgi:rod shape-determining protein MreC